MMDRYALLLDGAFVCKRLAARDQRAPSAEDVQKECKRIGSHERLKNLQLLRIYFYDAPPASEDLKNPISGDVLKLGQNDVYRRQRSLHDQLELAPDFALRQGQVVVRNWKVRPRALAEAIESGRALRAEDLQPDIQQKGVDLRIGLDIARLSMQRLASVIVVATGDSDMVPAFKFARREGIRVYLDHLGAPVNRELKAHVDVVL